MFERDQYRSDKEAIKMKMDELIFDLEKRISEEKHELETELETQKLENRKQVNWKINSNKITYFNIL